MTRRYLIGAVLLVVVILAIGSAVYVGFGPLPGGDSGEDIERFPTADGAGDGDSTSNGQAESPPFAFTIGSIQDCGETCRDITASLENNQNEAATNVTVYVRLFAGQDTTATDALIWEGTEDAGTIAAGDSFTTTKRVELSIQQALQVEQADGWITILTTVESDETVVTFNSSDQVA